MCAGAIFWSNIGRLVFGLSQNRFYEMVGEVNTESLRLSCQEVFATGNKSIKVIGPVLEEEALIPHLNFW